ncbi:MAG: PASTA domain-containing protein [Solobacterium sp.]|nr:PASTA domain-containing protein [Solobacterium sp.]
MSNKKKDFLGALSEEVNAKKQGKVTKIRTIDDYKPIQPVNEEDDFDIPDIKETKTAVQPPVQKPVEPVEEEEESGQPASFTQETFHRIEKPTRTFPKAAILPLVLLCALAAGLIYWLGFAPKIVMPEFTGKKISDVSSWARQNKIDNTSIATVEEYSLEYPDDYVISQTVNAGKKIKSSTPITITVSKGPDPDEKISFPDIRNMTLSELQEWKEENQLLKTKITTQYSTTVENGGVISFDLKNVSESDFTRGSTLNIVCSKGEAPASQVTVEDFRNKTAAEAEQWASNKKVTVMKQEQFSDKVPQGSIISQTPSSGSAMKQGDTITIVVSKGKGILIPRLVGYTAEQLQAWQSDSKNSVIVIPTSVYNEAPNGSVISQSIQPGMTVESGTVLELKISLYLPIFETNSRQWLGVDYLELKKWVDDANFKGANIQAGEYGEYATRVCSDDYPTPGSVINYSCEYGTQDSNGSTAYSSGCERPLNLYSRIGYQVSTGPCTVPTPPPVPTPSDVVITGNDLVSLSAIESFCSSYGMSCTYTKDDTVSNVKVTVNGNTYQTGDNFQEILKSGAKIHVWYNTAPGKTPEPTPEPTPTPTPTPGP